MPAAWPVFFYGAVVLALTIAEYRQDRKAQRFFKPLAALGFLLLALTAGAMDSLYGQIILGALVLCAFGDLLLLSRDNKKIFTAGIVAFLLGHLGLIGGFVHLGPSGTGMMIGAGIAVVIFAIFLRWLFPEVPPDMKTPVSFYMIVIGVMLVTAFGAGQKSGLWLLALGAALFAISDVFVAWDRFVANLPVNALIITPLYFGAQAIFALSV